MKKFLISLALTGLTFSGFAARQQSMTFLAPNIVSISLSNVAGLGVTNLLVGAQMNGNTWTNGVGVGQAQNIGLTNWAGAGLFTMYTQAVNNSVAPPGLMISGTNLPGVLVVDVTTNLNLASAGSFGIPPFSASNLTWAKTNDAQNLFRDVIFPSDFSPMFDVMPGATVGPVNTNNSPGVSYSGAIEVQLLGSQLTGTANGSNYVTFVFAPLAGDGTQIINTQVPAVSGNFPSLVPFTLLVTNSASSTALCTSIIPIPTSLLYGASGLRLVSATPGSAWTTGGNLWLTRLNFVTIGQ